MFRKRFLGRNQQVVSKNTTQQLVEVGALAQRLQEALQHQFSQLHQLQIRCAVKEGTLLVLAEHLLHIEPDPQLTFAVFEQVIKELAPEFAQSEREQGAINYPNSLPTRFFLRVAGYQQPYAIHSFTLDLLSAPSSHVHPNHVRKPALEPASVPQPNLPQVEASPIVAPIEPPPRIIRLTEPPIAPPFIPSSPSVPIEQPATSESAYIESAPTATPPQFLILPEVPSETIQQTPPKITSDDLIIADTTVAEFVQQVSPEVTSGDSIADINVAESVSIETEQLTDSIETAAPLNPSITDTDVENYFTDTEVDALVTDTDVEDYFHEIEQRPIAPLRDHSEASDPTIVDLSITPIDPINPIDPIADSLEQPDTSITDTSIADPPTPEVEPITVTIEEEEAKTPQIEDTESIQSEINEIESIATVLPEADIPEEIIVDEPIVNWNLESVESTNAPVEQLSETIESSTSNFTVEEPISYLDTSDNSITLIPPEQIVDFSDLFVIDESVDLYSSEQIEDTSEPIAVEPIEFNSFEQATDSFIASNNIPQTTNLDEYHLIDEPITQDTFDQVETIPDPIASEPIFNEWITRHQHKNGSIATPVLDETNDETKYVTNGSAKRSSLSNPSLTSSNIHPAILSLNLTRRTDKNASAIDRLPVKLDELPKRSKSRLPLSNVMMIGSVGLFVAVSGLYALTRPCVTSAVCQPLEQAKQMNQQSLQIIQANPVALEIVNAYDRLTQAKLLLETIPFWSRHYREAQALLADSEQKTQVMSLVVKALNQANIAAKRSQNPPHPVQHWREIQLLWQDTIALLEQVPADSPVYPLANEKLIEYRANLDGINQQIAIEQEAQERVTAVREAAEVAEARSSVVNTPETWQQMIATWQTIIEQLTQIPQGTMAHSEAQQLLKIFQAKLTDAQNRQTQEERAIVVYNKATSLAEQAQTLQQQNQWSQAAAYWREALVNVRQVAEGSSYYSRSQALVGPYLAALQQAELNAKQSTALQTAKADLDQVCARNPRICTYTLATNTIRVQLTPEYDQVVQNVIVAAQLQGDPNIRADAVNQVNGLLQSLSTISNSTQIPIELYNSDGSRLAIYTPNSSGYVIQ